jgi:hypothetical protein
VRQHGHQRLHRSSRSGNGGMSKDEGSPTIWWLNSPPGRSGIQFNPCMGNCR